MPATGICGHCGQVCGDYAGGFSFVPAPGNMMMLVCHPNDETRPDCFRRISVYREPLGALMAADPKPAGLAGIPARQAILDELCRLGQQLAVPATVCTAHLRFVPCRTRDGCVISQDPEDVARVAAHQRGTDARPV